MRVCCLLTERSLLLRVVGLIRLTFFVTNLLVLHHESTTVKKDDSVNCFSLLTYEDSLVVVLSQVDCFNETITEDLQSRAIGVLEDDTQLVVYRVHTRA